VGRNTKGIEGRRINVRDGVVQLQAAAFWSDFSLGWLVVLLGVLLLPQASHQNPRECAAEYIVTT
jgi:hypothetical protein